MGANPRLSWIYRVNLFTLCSLCIIPGSAFPLSNLYYGGGTDHEQTMTIYADGSARLWDMKAREFRRAMDLEKARDTLGRSAWQEVCA